MNNREAAPAQAEAPVSAFKSARRRRESYEAMNQRVGSEIKPPFQKIA
jgi:hypothetical protein